MPERENLLMLKAACIAAVLFLFAGFANAQVPGGNIFFGYSYESTELVRVRPKSGRLDRDPAQPERVGSLVRG